MSKNNDLLPGSRIDGNQKYPELIGFLDQQPINPAVQYALENQVYFQILYFKDLLENDTELCKDYLRQEIQSAERIMSDLIYNRTVPTFYMDSSPETIEKFTWNKERLLIYISEYKALSAGNTAKPVDFITLFSDVIVDRSKSAAQKEAQERIRLIKDCLTDYLDENNNWRKIDEKSDDANLIIVPWHVLREHGIIREPKPYGRAADMRAWCLFFGHELTASQQRYFPNDPLSDLMKKFEKMLMPLIVRVNGPQIL